LEQGCPGRFDRPEPSVVDFAAADVPEASLVCQLSDTFAGEPRWCRFGDLGSPRSTIALVGNSYAAQLVPLVREWTRGRHVRVLLAARTDCLGLNTVPVSGQAPGDPCLTWSVQVQAKLLKIPDLSLVVLVGHERSDSFLTGQVHPSLAALTEARRNVLGSLSLLRRANIPTVVVKHAPGTRPLPAPVCVAGSETTVDPCVQPREAVTGMDFLSTLAKGHPELTNFLSLDRYFCTAHQCHAVIGGLVAYSDALHISATYARTMGTYVGPRLDRIRHLTRPPAPRGS
jgi:hypothetical protein